MELTISKIIATVLPYILIYSIKSGYSQLHFVSNIASIQSGSVD